MKSILSKGFKEMYTNGVIPFYMAWHYDVEDKCLEFIGNRHMAPLTWSMTLPLLAQRIKPCFEGMYKNILDLMLLNGDGLFREHEKKGGFIKLLVPMRLRGEGYTLVEQALIPNIEKGEVKEFVMVAIPIKEYGCDPFVAEVHSHAGLDLELTGRLWTHLSPYSLLSRRQREMVRLISMGLSSREIAMYLDRSIAAVYKMNRKILEKISEHYEMVFGNAREAIAFHLKNQAFKLKEKPL